MNTFSGRYLTEQSNKNIGHESMNFFLPNGTDDNFLLWLNSSGIINAELNKPDIDITLLMVTNFENEADKFRVLGLAKNCKVVDGADIPDNSNTRKIRFDKFNEQFPNAKYGNTLVKDIFKDNTYQGKPDGENTLATLFTNKRNVFVPSDPNWTIRIKEDSNADIKKNMGNERMRIYIEDDAEFENIVGGDDKWIEFNEAIGCFDRYPMRSCCYEVGDTFFLATRNEKDELTLSNILAYSLMNSPDLLNALTDKLIGERGFNGADFKIEREDKHVDLTITLPDKTIIIENKIDSAIVEKGYKTKEEMMAKTIRAFNYLKPGKEPQKRADAQARFNARMELYNDVVDKIERKIDAINPDRDGKMCQLTKYYIQSLIDSDLDNRQNCDIYYFFLVPDYAANKFSCDTNGYLQGYAYGGKYKLIKYSDIFEVFDGVPSYKYRDDIITELKMLSSKVNDFQQRRQMYIFLKKAGL